MADDSIRVSRVSIENFRCFERLEGDLNRLTSIVGENGSGKTALIEALNYCLAPYTSAARFCEQDFNAQDAGDITIIVTFNKSFIAEVPDGYTTQKIECDRVYLRASRRKAAGAGRALNDPFTLEHRAVPIEGKYGSEPNWSLERGTGSTFKFTPRTLALSNVELSDYPTVQYFGKERERQSEVGFNTTFKRILDELNWRYRKGCGGNEAAILAAWDTYYDLVLDSVPDKTRTAIIGDFKDAATALLGAEFDDLELSLSRLEEPFSKGFLATRDGLGQVAIGGMGSGVAMLLTLVLLETVSGLEKEALIFLIDEPEMHLHPQLQTRVRQHLADSENQVIYTTHSPLMVNLGEWRSVRRMDGGLRLFPTHTTRELVLENEKGEEFLLQDCLDDIISKQKHITMLMRENNEMLFARCVVLVEGAADRHAITLLAEPAGYDLRDITVIPVHGKTKIPDYQLLCMVFGLPFFTVYDKDTGEGNDPKTNALINKLATDNWVYEFDPNLEECFGIGKNSEHKGQKTVDAISVCAEKPDDIPEQVGKLLKVLDEFQTDCLTPSAPEAVMDDLAAVAPIDGDDA